jgi:DNA topoisomerase VI subunit B
MQSYFDFSVPTLRQTLLATGIIEIIPTMALRAFHANPCIGGFGGESSTPNLIRPNNRCVGQLQSFSTDPGQSAGDAFCQIVKELVDNAVDAINSSLENDEQENKGKSKKRIRVEIMPYQPSSNNDGNDDSVPSQGLLQVSILDNGCGMENIQDCVNAFQSSKAYSQYNTTGMDKHQRTTSGRYGIGLTLCLLHAQRLVPYSYACITSTKKGWRYQARAFFVVDPEDDRILCDTEEQIPKQGDYDSSGTCVSLLIPVSPSSTLKYV